MIKYKKLVDISSPKQWKNLSVSKLLESGYPVYGANGIIGYYDEYNHEKSTIAITCRGATSGSIHLTEPKAFITSNAMALDGLDESECNINYLAFFLKYRGLKDVISGSAQPQITRTNLERVEIPLPHPDDQIRIATILSRVETLIATRKDNLRLLDEFLKSTFLEMFGDPVGNERGWDTIPFSKIGQFYSGGTPSKKRKDYWTGSFPWVSPKDMKTRFISDAQDHIADKVFEETSLKRIDPGHLLIVVRGMILAHSFPVAINSVPVAINQDMKAILPKAEYNVYYLLVCMQVMKRQVLSLISSAGHGTKRFDGLAMEKLMVPCPPPDLQSKFEQIVKKIKTLKTLYLDYLVTEETKKAFQNNFASAMDLFQHLQILLILNLYAVSEPLKRDLYLSDSLYVSETVPTLPADDRIMRFEDLVLKKSGVDAPIYARSLSDGEYQFIHSLGLCLLYRNTNSLFLLDEPETHFNPDWRSQFITRLRECFKSGDRNVQRDVLITTRWAT